MFSLLQRCHSRLSPTLQQTGIRSLAVTPIRHKFIVQKEKKFAQKPRRQEVQDMFYTWVLPEGHDTGIKVTNTYGSLGKKMDRQRVPLVVNDPQKISWYACGPTVYDSCHIGHASSYLRFDIIRRILSKFYDYNVVMVMGITDVDDKIVARANLVGADYSALSRKYEQEFYDDLDSLNILPAHTYVRVSDVIPEIIAFINTLIENGKAYSTSRGDVWFDHRCLPEKSSYLVPRAEEWNDGEKSAAGEKKSTHDFSLWKAVKPGEPYWEAPWGNGRPGWHIECSTISSLYFGDSLDIHSGAIDLRFPHHECEVQQCHAYHDATQWCNYFFHSGHLKEPKSGGKMSKSAGSVVTISDFVAANSPDVLRLMCMCANWHDDVNYYSKAVKQTRVKLERFQRFAYNLQQYLQGNMSRKVNRYEVVKRLARCREGVDSAFRDDFNTIEMLNVLSDFVEFVNAQMGEEVLLEQWREPDLDRSNKLMLEVLHYYLDLFRDLGFVSIKPHRYVK